jgi:small subunit ribosomal protein S21
MHVLVQPGEKNLTRALKRLKKMCEKAGLFADIRKHRHYETPSERRRRKMSDARRKRTRGSEPERPHKFNVSTYVDLSEGRTQRWP